MGHSGTFSQDMLHQVRSASGPCPKRGLGRRIESKYPPDDFVFAYADSLQYGGTLDVSLDKIPPNHQSLDARSLEAEASGLLDRMLAVLQESK